MLELTVRVTGRTAQEVEEALRDVLICVESGSQRGVAADDAGSCCFEIVGQDESALVEIG